MEQAAAKPVIGRLFHGVDERVPLEGLRFGVRVMTRPRQSC
ncbi:hypothetical protein AB0N06_10040 [Streptomyces sp. NPDC051020]